ncbi:MAG TPA: TIGR02530 family flagellar biosynthesis protein [Bacteroidota bacterium]|nr:TIGR02530 family flagellar biosynthesis protein [Bacteroidota bacterium]
MSDTIVNGIKVPFLPVGGVDGLGNRATIPLPEDRAFDKVLQRELEGLKFSKHAQERLSARNITLNEADLSSLQQAVSKADEKGSQDSLILLRDTAFIVSVKNRTVVTAVDAAAAKNNVFTNIDSAVIAG